MKDYLMKLKTIRTLYNDLHESFWTDEKPTNYYDEARMGKDYLVIRKGTVLFVKSDDYTLYGIEYKYACVTKNGKQIFFETLEDIKNFGWIEVIE